MLSLRVRAHVCVGVVEWLAGGSPLWNWVRSSRARACSAFIERVYRWSDAGYC
jgi:hypothetical protein